MTIVRKSRVVVACLVVVLGAHLALHAQAKKPNIVFIMADDLGNADSVTDNLGRLTRAG